ncbi:hypothetical protein [Luteolibacter sp. LG18]|uniref:hypothetical protein n=1 Tax=Luteolibacter sp. LG18 TaxID=2819286 RepID=UPI002B2E7135|nr:hypothetical protein llg_04290 [Luteolibacter sp. LG18]
MKTAFLHSVSWALLTVALHADPVAGGPPPAARVTVVALGSLPKSVVKWGTGGEVEYEMSQRQTMPPTGLQVKVVNNGATKYEPFPFTLNIPSMPVPFGAEGLALFGADAAKSEQEQKAPSATLTIPTVKGVDYQMVMMWRNDPKDDWSHPLFHPLDLSETSVPAGSFYFINFTQRSVRLLTPQTNQARPLAFKSGVVVPPVKGAPTLNYKIDCLGRNNEILPIVFSGLKADPVSRNVVVVYEGGDGRPVSATFPIPVKPVAESKKDGAVNSVAAH